MPSVSETVQRQVRFLVVDDESGVRQILQRIIARTFPQEAGVSVGLADSPEEALRQLDDIPADGSRLIVISDYNLETPTMTGISLLNEVRSRRPDARRVLISGYDRRVFQKELDTAGLDAFVTKPFRMAELRALLQKLAE